MTGRLGELLAARLALLPRQVGGLTPQLLLQRDAPGLSAPDHRSANRSCRLLEARDGWVALNLARPEDVELTSILCDQGAERRAARHQEGNNREVNHCEVTIWDVVADMARDCAASEFVARAVEFQLPAAALDEATSPPFETRSGGDAPRRVLDLSALWAGPLCAGLLAKAGAQVTRIESVRRRDPTPDTAPELDQFLNDAKERVALDLSDANDRARLLEMVLDADVLVTSARAPALARLGLAPETLFALRPRLIWAAITAHGSRGAGALRVGFGDDCAAAGGLVRRETFSPQFMGDALADPLTGIEAALAVFERTRQSSGGFIDIAMARVAAQYAREAS